MFKLILNYKSQPPTLHRKSIICFNASTLQRFNARLLKEKLLPGAFKNLGNLLSLVWLFASIISLCTLNGCRKPNYPAASKDKPTALNRKETARALTKLILPKAKDKAFSNFVKEACLEQRNGDYMVAISKLLELSNNRFFTKDEEDLCKRYLKPFEGANQGELFSIYIPSLEKFDKRYPLPSPQNPWSKSSTAPIAQHNENGTTAIITEEEYIDPSYGSGNGTGVYPGYVIDPFGNLSYVQDIDEPYSWHNDVWIFGFQEVLSPEAERIADLDLADPVSGINQNRAPGEIERAGFFQVMEGQLGNLKPWVTGKIPMRMIVISGLGTVITDKTFGKLRRWRFMSEKWVDYDVTVGAWHLNTFGNYTLEKWIVVRGGSTTSSTISQPSVNGGPAFSTTVTTTTSSNDLGIGLVQFTDAKSTVYNSMSYSRFKRK
ncbi:MAG TPA: hypothetical protein PKD90_06935 [Phnomibacter sp.]|nr:hypothetical protein [Phnomibacter sp.]